MSQDLLATFRMETPILVSGVTHKAHVFLKGVVSGGSGHTVKLRDNSDLLWQTVATNYQRVLTSIYGTGTQIGTHLLQQKVGTQWQTIETFNTSPLTYSGTNKLGSQVTLTLRDSAYLPVKVIVLDCNQNDVPFVINSPTGGDGAMDNFCGWFLQTPLGGDETPFAYMVSRGNRYLSNSPFVSASGDINRITKKAHGL